MKRKILICIISCFIIFSPFLFLGCNISNENKELTNYNLNLEYDENSQILTGTEIINYINNYDNMFTSLYFHLYPNAFREGAKISVVSSANEEEAYPNGINYGNIEVKQVSSENTLLEYMIEGEDKNILRIELNKELYPDERIELKIEFDVKLANINHRLGVGENTINFGNFYPIACMYENGKGFSQELYHSNGDPFYSECANYEVNITFSDKFKIACTGELHQTINNQNKTIVKYKASNVRDFCFVLSEKFEVVSKTFGNTTINYYGYENDDNLQSCLDVSINALQTFNEIFGEYPYEQLNVVKSNFVHGGMEYPNLVLISDKYQLQQDINYVIVHEIAHQWWYGVVGNDEYNHAWMDEGLAEYSTYIFFREHEEYGLDFDELIKNATESYKLFEKVYINVTGSVNGTMDRGLNEFLTEPEYVQCTYTKGVLLFNTIEESVGEKKFLKAMQTYYKNFKYKNASPADMINVFSKTTGYNLEDVFNSYIYGKVIIK